jgi:hypothetical protein
METVPTATPAYPGDAPTGGRASEGCDRMSRPADGGGAAATTVSGREPPAILLFDRLLSRYQRRFGALPPVSGVGVEEANRLMRAALAAAGAAAGGPPRSARPG